MLDMSFGELLVIGVVALVVIGPTRLPTVARTVGRMVGKMQRYVAEVKSEVQREIDLEELRKMQSSVEDAAKSIESSMRENMDGINQEAKNLEGEWKKAEEQLRHISPPATMPVMGFGHTAPEPSNDAAEGTHRSGEIAATGDSALPVLTHADDGGQKELAFEPVTRSGDIQPGAVSAEAGATSSANQAGER